MARDPEGYNEVLRFLLNRYGPLMTKAQVSEATGICMRLVATQIYGWEGEHRGKKLKATLLARQMCR